MKLLGIAAVLSAILAWWILFTPLPKGGAAGRPEAKEPPGNRGIASPLPPTAPSGEPAKRQAPSPIPRNVSTSADPTPSDNPDEMFSPETMDEVDTVLAELPELQSLNDLGTTKEYLKWRKETLPDFQWAQELAPHLDQGLMIVAAAQGIDSARFGIPGQRPRAQIHLAMDTDHVRRALAYVVEGDVEGYTGELKRAVDEAVVNSMIDGEGAPIRFSQAPK